MNTQNQTQTTRYLQAYTKDVQTVLADLKTSTHGLTVQQVVESAKMYGSNTLPEAPKTSRFTIFLRQFQSSIIYILLVAATVVYFLGEHVDASIILAVLIINAIVGTIQEGKAEDTLAALKNFATTTSTVIRDGAEDSIPDTELVVGDIIVLREGDKVGADARLIQMTDLLMDESSLTGESEAVEKTLEQIEGTASLATESFKQRNMVFKGTMIQGGFALAVVTAVGVDTVIGNISGELSAITTDVPLKESIKKLSRWIIVMVLLVGLFTFFIGLLKGYSVTVMVSIVIAMSVSAIPEGLPITVTLILAAGVYRMGKKNALIKKLQAVEALGHADVIATDKTGTLTMNQMMIQQIFSGGSLYDVSGVGYEPKGTLTKDEVDEQGNKVRTTIDAKLHDELLMLGKISALVSNSPIVYDESKQIWKRVGGDPTESALTAFSQKLGFLKDEILGEMPLLAEVAFSSDTKYHAVLHKDGIDTLYAVAGAPEVILNKCGQYLKKNKSLDMTIGDREQIEKAIQTMAGQGLRVIALATKKNPPKYAEEVGKLPELVFVGLVGISDALREGIFESVQKAQSAGITIVMITGDYIETAKAIAEKAGIYRAGDVALTGDDLASLTDDKLREILPKVTVFARVTPEHKFKIVQLYRSLGKVIGMTGDGVNDALSLAAADLGIAMGKTGTEVAKEAADIILLDDNFKSIVSAIEEGRYIYHSIKKVITYLLATSIAEIFIIVGALIAGYPLALQPSQIIWLNFVTDGFLVLALAMEQNFATSRGGSATGANILKKPDSKSKSLVTRPMQIRIVVTALTMMIGTLAVFVAYLGDSSASNGMADYMKATTMALTVLAVFQWFNAWSCRSEHHSVFSIPLFSNIYLVWSTGIILVLQLLAVYWAPLQFILKTVPLNGGDWLVVLAVASSVVVVDEIRKLFSRL
ncbi:MAG: P-type Ca2+ transporter type [Patescibacteria group bacterium]|nr:P-type Ca2+ transporter type [Patescibacteria group bacterium]